jgi:hypothetical protein
MLSIYTLNPYPELLRYVTITENDFHDVPYSEDRLARFRHP